MDGRIDEIREAIEGLLRAANHNVGGMAPGVIASWCYKALASLSAIDPESIKRECAYKAKQAILSAPYDNPTRAYAAALAEAAIFSAEPALNMPKCTKPDDAECHANSRGRCYNGFQCKPAQDDGKAESEESKDERLATKQLLGAGCHDECGPLPEEDQ